MHIQNCQGFVSQRDEATHEISVKQPPVVRGPEIKNLEGFQHETHTDHMSRHLCKSETETLSR